MRVLVDPQDVVVAAGSTYVFHAEARRGNEKLDEPVHWSASGGDISSKGKYTAGAKPGKFWVAVARSGGETDTARVELVSDPPVAQLLDITPDAVTLLEGEAQTFQALLYDENGTVISGSVIWQTSGGGITQHGEYTALAGPGTYHVSASWSDAIVDTTVVTVIAAASNIPPSAGMDVDCSELTCVFSSTSHDEDGHIVSYRWEFGDGEEASTGSAEHTYGSTGQYTVVLTVTDNAGAEATTEQTVTVSTESEDPADFDVVVEPGNDIQTLVDANPAGTSFLLRSGRHVGQSVTPKSGQVFVGEPGAILDGQGTTQFAFKGHDGNPNVEIRGLVIENYDPDDLMGAIRAGYFWDWPDQTSSGWRILDNEIRYNSHAGVSTAQGIVIRGNYIHHNGQTGITGYWDNVLIEDNEVAYNNPDGAFDPGFEAGGMKLKRTRNLTVRGNHVHHNTGRGIWTDIDNIDVLVEDNLVEDNTYAGIFHEISYDAVIRNNTVRRNAIGNPYAQSWLWGSGILIANSTNVQVYGNLVEDNANGIGGIDQARGSGAFGPRKLIGLDVHDNTITMNIGWSGVVQDFGNTAVFTSENNLFSANTYNLGPNSRYFRWQDNQRTEAEWQAYGHDTNGAFHR